MTARAFLRFSLREAARLAGLRCRLCRAERAEADEPHGDVPYIPPDSARQPDDTAAAQPEGARSAAGCQRQRGACLPEASGRRDAAEQRGPGKAAASQDPLGQRGTVMIAFIGDSLHWRTPAMHGWEPVPRDIQDEMAREWLAGRERLAEAFLRGDTAGGR